MEQYFSSTVTGISQEPYKSTADRLYRRYGTGVVIPCTIVPEPENPYDPNAIRVVVQAATGPECPGYIEARRYCPFCRNSKEGKRGYRSYTNEHGAPPSVCPLCGTGLTKATTEVLAPLLRNTGVEVKANLMFNGKEPGKENLGGVVRITILLPDDEE